MGALISEHTAKTVFETRVYQRPNSRRRAGRLSKLSVPRLQSVGQAHCFGNPCFAQRTQRI
jgi:hypothetical protein